MAFIVPPNTGNVWCKILRDTAYTHKLTVYVESIRRSQFTGISVSAGRTGGLFTHTTILEKSPNLSANHSKALIAYFYMKTAEPDSGICGKQTN